MSEAGKRLIKAAKEMRQRVTKSCGCVFCDLGLRTDDTVNGRPVHSHRKGGWRSYSFCTHPDVPASLPAPFTEDIDHGE